MQRKKRNVVSLLQFAADIARCIRAQQNLLLWHVAELPSLKTNFLILADDVTLVNSQTKHMQYKKARMCLFKLIFSDKATEIYISDTLYLSSVTFSIS